METFRQSNQKLRVCYYGSYDLNEPHNSTHLAGFRAAGLDVIECHLPASDKRDQASNYQNLLKTLAFALRFVTRSFSGFFKLWRIKGIDAMIVGYPGYFDLPLAKVYAALKRIPLLFNVHISLYETLVEDRGYFRSESIMARCIKAFDRLLFTLADVIIVDTNAHGEYFAQLYKIPREKFKRVFIGADPEFRPLPYTSNEVCRVLFYGTFIPLQGIEHIIDAAHLLRDEKDLRFKIIGRGQTKEQIVAKARDLQCENVEFIDWLSREELAAEIADAEICLGGQFGLTKKAELVIGYKCFQLLAMKKAVIVSDSAGNRELLAHGQNCLMCPPGDGKALAGAIRELRNAPAHRRELARNGFQRFQELCDTSRIGERLKEIVAECVGRLENRQIRHP